VFAQHEVFSDVETSANDVHIPVLEFAHHTKPVCILKKLDLKLDLTRFEKEFILLTSSDECAYLLIVKCDFYDQLQQL